jgi:hypothetical protein
MGYVTAVRLESGGGGGGGDHDVPQANVEGEAQGLRDLASQLVVKPGHNSLYGHAAYTMAVVRTMALVSMFP